MALAPEPDSQLPAILLLGSPLRNGDDSFLQPIRRAGFRVIDATTGSARTNPDFGFAVESADAVRQIARIYLGTIHEPFQKPNSGYLQQVKKLLKHSDARAVIMRRYTWCDIWHVEALRLKKEVPVPLLDIVIDDEGNASSESRMEAFMEILLR